MVWACAEDRCRVYQEENAEDGAATQEEKGQERPKKRFMDTVREDMREVGVTEEDAVNRVRWGRMIHCGDP